MSFLYYAIISPKSKYASQSDGKPFPIEFVPEFDGYHWHGNMNRYADIDLVRLVPVEPTAIFFRDMSPEEVIEYGACPWYQVQEHQGTWKHVDFRFVSAKGQTVERGFH